MRQVSLREFRTLVTKAFDSISRNETVLLTGQNGPAYFWVPAVGDLALEDQDLRKVLDRASLCESLKRSTEGGFATVTDVEIDAEIQQARDSIRDTQL